MLNTTQTLKWMALTSSVLAMLLALAGCDDDDPIVPDSLDSPRALTLARGEVCLRTVEVADGVFGPQVQACEAGEIGSIGLIVNDQSNQLAVADMSLTTPRLLDLDVSVPGVTSLAVGRFPVDVTSNKTGDVAFTANQLDKTLSLINLWWLRTLPDVIELPGTPLGVKWSSATDKLVVSLNAPSGLFLREGASCTKPSNLSTEDRRTVDPSQDCTISEDEGTRVDLKAGTLSAMTLDEAGAYAYVLYADRPILSVVALEALVGDERCLNGALAAPCEVHRVSLTHECRDGLDNDGDGVADQQDPQCFGPLGSESPDGIGRLPQDVCADGLDNDGDGFFDRDDPECRLGLGTSESEVTFDLGPVACADAVDNDGDGAVDYPSDPSCYGAYGRREGNVFTQGFTALGIDELGTFIYVLDSNARQALVVDVSRRVLVDAARATPSQRAYTDDLGIQVSSTSVPTAVTGRVSRAIIANPNEELASTSAVIRYDYGAYVATDGGFVYYIDTARVYCEIEGEEILSNVTFYENPEARLASKESGCLTLPAFPLPQQSNAVQNCSAVATCESCLEQNNNDFDECGECESIRADFPARTEACRLQRRVIEQDDVRVVVNPRFSERDRRSERGGVLGRALCEQPDTLLNDMKLYAAENEFNGSFNCGSPLMPQPLSVSVPTSEARRPVDFLLSSRLDFIEQRTLRAVFDEQTGQVVDVLDIVRDDQRLLAEDITVIYEGAIPSTRRDDAVVSSSTEGVLDTGGFDLCAAGIEVGDWLTLKTPAQGAGCDAFDSPGGREDFLRYQVAAITDEGLTLAVIANDASNDRPDYVQSLPTRGCFAQALEYEVRPNASWLVYGSRSGVISSSTRVAGTCVPTLATLEGRSGSRAKTGELFSGLYYSFFLYPGFVEPSEDLSFTMQLVRNFSPSSTENSRVLEPQTTNPTQVLFADRLPNGRFIFVLDPNDNAIFGQNLATVNDAFFLR